MIRKDIQGLRAIAVIVVLLFHFWPDRLSGGYVGVDVFFVISGFLITSHLLRKPPVSRKMLVDFWARRIKRLIPAATLVLFVTVLASILWLPETMLQRTVHEAAAAAIYGENWMLAATATDYLASEDAPSPIQHYWSLSIEEQYYALWPVIIGGIFLLSRRFLTSNKLLAIGLAVIFTTSLAYSIYLTANNPAAAYFVTPTRIWELALGGIVALISSRFTASARLAVPMAWAGLAMIAATVVLFTKQTPFPGYTALLPTVGTALVILAATDGMKWSPRRLLGWRPAQFMGDISYSVYLWHWPVVVIAPFALGGDYLTFAQKLVFIAIVVILSYITKVLVEDPVRSNKMLMKTNKRTYAYGVASILVVVAVSLGTATVNHSKVALAQKTLESAIESNDPCLGAAAMRNTDCNSVAGDKLLMTPALAREDKAKIYDDNCRTVRPFTDYKKCSYGKLDSSTKIALIGNSHAGMWFGALEEIALKNEWKLDTYIASACYTALAPLDFEVQRESDNCLKFNEWAIETIRERDYAAIVISNLSASDLKGVDPDGQFDAKVSAYTKTLDRLVSADNQVLVIHDIPSGGKNVPDCIAQAQGDDLAECNNEKNKVERQDPLYESATKHASVNINTLNVDDNFCKGNTCYTIIGGLIVYFDVGHMSDTYSRTLAPDIAPKLKSIVETSLGK